MPLFVGEDGRRLAGLAAAEKSQRAERQGSEGGGLGDYALRYAETHAYRAALGLEIGNRLGWAVRQGSINCLLTRPEARVDVDALVENCRRQGVYLRGGAAMGSQAEGWIRISVRTPEENLRIVDALSEG